MAISAPTRSRKCWITASRCSRWAVASFSQLRSEAPRQDSCELRSECHSPGTLGISPDPSDEANPSRNRRLRNPRISPRLWPRTVVLFGNPQSEACRSSRTRDGPAQSRLVLDLVLPSLSSSSGILFRSPHFFPLVFGPHTERSHSWMTLWQSQQTGSRFSTW